jgi:hypothetical protein
MLVVAEKRMDGEIIISKILLLHSIKIYIFCILKVLHVHQDDQLERCAILRWDLPLKVRVVVATIVAE